MQKMSLTPSSLTPAQVLAFAQEHYDKPVMLYDAYDGAMSLQNIRKMSAIDLVTTVMEIPTNVLKTGLLGEVAHLPHLICATQALYATRLLGKLYERWNSPPAVFEGAQEEIQKKQQEELYSRIQWLVYRLLEAMDILTISLSTGLFGKVSHLPKLICATQALRFLQLIYNVYSSEMKIIQAIKGENYGEVMGCLRVSWQVQNLASYICQSIMRPMLIRDYFAGRDLNHKMVTRWNYQNRLIYYAIAFFHPLFYGSPKPPERLIQ